MYDVLMQRILQQEKAIADLHQEIETLKYNSRKSYEAHISSKNCMDAVFERLTVLEDKVLPTFGPMLKSIEKVVGAFTTWSKDNPLDRR
jgi:hypothetical protein